MIFLLFIKVPWVGLRCMIVVFPDNTHLLFFLSIPMKHFIDFSYLIFSVMKIYENSIDFTIFIIELTEILY